MVYQQIKPSRPLAPFIRSFWILEGNTQANLPGTYRLMADAMPNFVFHYKNQFFVEGGGRSTKGSIGGFRGQTTRYKALKVLGEFGLIGVYLFSYSVPVLFGYSAKELTDQLLDLDTFMGKEGRLLEEQIIMAQNNIQRIHILERFFLQRLACARKMDTISQSCIQQILYAKEEITLQDLAKQANISKRQLERKFSTYAGLSPKLFSRVIRFQKTLKSTTIPTKNLTQLAYEKGYYDQSHFIRDFKEFSGLHPKFYFKQAEEVADNFVGLS